MSAMFLILIFIFIHMNQAQSIFTSHYLLDNKYPFVLPFINTNFYYIITSKNFLKINKLDGSITLIESHNQIFEYSNGL